jgi:hypothetical protein
MKITAVRVLDPASGYDYQVDLEDLYPSFALFRAGVPSWYKRAFGAPAVKVLRCQTLERSAGPSAWAGGGGKYRMLLAIRGGADPRDGIPPVE